MTNTQTPEHQVVFKKKIRSTYWLWPNFDLATQKIKKPKSTAGRGSKGRKSITTTITETPATDETKSSRTATPNLDTDADQQQQSLIEDSPTTSSISGMSTTTLPMNELKRSASMAQHDLDYPDETKK